MLAFSGHKGLLSPLGTGGLYVGDNISLEPVLFGGTGSYSESLIQPKVMPDLLQCGTLNTPAIMAMGAGVDYIRRMTPEGLGEKERRLAERFIGEILNMSNVTVYGLADGKDRNGTVAFNIRNMDSVETAQRLNDDFRICVRGGWHCAYHAHAAIGSEKEGAVRASFGAFDNMRSVEQIVDAVNKIAQKSV